MKVGRIKDPIYKDSYFGITPPTFIPPFEAPDTSTSEYPWTLLRAAVLEPPRPLYRIPVWGFRVPGLGVLRDMLCRVWGSGVYGSGKKIPD